MFWKRLASSSADDANKAHVLLIESDIPTKSKKYNTTELVDDFLCNSLLNDGLLLFTESICSELTVFIWFISLKCFTYENRIFR